MRLNSWKEISAYAKFSTRTLQRFEQLEGFRCTVSVAVHEAEFLLIARKSMPGCQTDQRVTGSPPPHRMENALMRHRALVQDLSGKIRAMKSILAKGEAIWGPGLSRNVRIGTP